VAIDISTEQIFPLTEAPKRRELPRRRFQRPPHVATFYRWAKYGVRGVRLETIRVGGTRCTSLQAIQRFFNALSATDQLHAPSTGSARRRKSEEASQALTAEGL
jgi:hypothetical protein